MILNVSLFVAKTSDVPRMPANNPNQEGKDQQTVPNLQHLTPPSLKSRRIPTDRAGRAEMSSGSEEGSYSRLTDVCTTHLWARGK